MNQQITGIREDPNDWLFSGGGIAAKFDQPGTKISGYVLREPKTIQMLHYTTREPLTWKDGSPKNQMRVVLMTDEKDPNDEEDSGERIVYIKPGNMRNAVADAVRRAGGTGIAVGGRLVIQYTRNDPNSTGPNPAKEYIARYQLPEAAPVPLPTEPASSNGAPNQLPELPEIVDPESIPF